LRLARRRLRRRLIARHRRRRDRDGARRLGPRLGILRILRALLLRPRRLLARPELEVAQLRRPDRIVLGKRRSRA
jgi:hypothetical protein